MKTRDIPEEHMNKLKQLKDNNDAMGHAARTFAHEAKKAHEEFWNFIRDIIDDIPETAGILHYNEKDNQVWWIRD